MGPPPVESSFDLGEQLHANHAAKRENTDTDKDLIRLKRRSGHGDHETDARGCRVELTDQHADQRATDRETQTGENEWHRRRNHDSLKDHPFGGAEASRCVQQIQRRGFNAIPRIDQDRKHRAEKNNADFGKNAYA